MGTYTIVQSAAQCCSSEHLEQHWNRVNAELQMVSAAATETYTLD